VDTYPYEDHVGERWLNKVAEYDGVRWSGVVLHDPDGFHPWILTWTDGINVWNEGWHDVSVALTRFAALVRAADTDRFLTHPAESRAGSRAFATRSEEFLEAVIQPHV